MNGATAEELKKAVAYGTKTRHLSLVLQGIQIDLQEFKKEFQQMMTYMSDQEKANQ